MRCLVNLGYLVLQALLEHWPQTHQIVENGHENPLATGGLLLICVTSVVDYVFGQGKVMRQIRGKR